ncbi:MAG: YjjG family noncanonical pyrimidine nucleotidase [Clostridia bacterium]|nr:YjjG family noncanonical pyrimidine nucleotidase [Clostridia bacterium]
MSKIKHVFLDLDDTLFDFHKSEAVALSKTFRTLGVEPTDDILRDYSEINRSMWQMLERGEATRADILTRRFRILFEKMGRSDISHVEAQAIYERTLSGEWCWYTGGEELVKALYGKYHLYIASNGTAVVQDGRISLSGIAKYFDGIFISQRIGYDKPSREFFEGCFAAIPNFSRDEAIILGDSLGSDILGGINAGITTCHFNPKGLPQREDIRADYEISTLSEFVDILRRI